MVISILRKPSAKGATLSTRHVDGRQFCFEVEDVVRGPSETKVYSKTAIPTGTYRLRITTSNRYCLLPGSALGSDGVSGTASRVAFDKLFLLIEQAVTNNESITLTTN